MITPCNIYFAFVCLLTIIYYVRKVHLTVNFRAKLECRKERGVKSCTTLHHVHQPGPQSGQHGDHQDQAE
jgi:hypothetical protein